MAWWIVKRQICVHFKWMNPVNGSRYVNRLHGNCMYHKCMARSEQPVLFSEHLIATFPPTGKQTRIVFYKLKRLLPVAPIRINFSVNTTDTERYSCLTFLWFLQLSG